MIKSLIQITGAVLIAALLVSCEFFVSEQEENGINPKPFNSQATWENETFMNIRN